MENINIMNIGDMIEAMRFLQSQTVVGADGTFSLDSVEPGEYVLEVYTLDTNPGRPISRA